MSSSTPKSRLAVAMIARDAQETIGEALASVRAIADSMVVVDTGSLDRTRALATAAGATVSDYPWRDSFASARNFAWSKVSADWVLWLDASEQVPAETAAAIRQWVDAHPQPNIACSLLIALPASEPHLAGQQICRIRLVPHHGRLSFSGRVREQLHAALQIAGVAVEDLPLVIRRSARDNDPEVRIAKSRRDLKLLDLEIKDRGQQPDLLVALGETLMQLGDSDGAAASFRLALGRCAPTDRARREAYCGLLLASSAQGQPWQDQLAICGEALEHFPLDAQLLCALGGYLQAQGQHGLAAQAYQTAWLHGQVDRATWHHGEIREIAASCLAITRQMQNDDQGSLDVLQAVLAQNPRAVLARRHLVDLHIKHNRRREALDEIDRLPTAPAQRDALRSATRGACLAARQNWVPAVAYLQTAYNAGCRDMLCLRWLAIGLVNQGKITAAAPILRQWQALEPRNLEARNYCEALDAGALTESHGSPTPFNASGGVLRLDAPAISPPAASQSAPLVWAAANRV